MAAATLSTHVLDTGTGRPADGVLVSVFRGDELVGTGTTDADGRIRELGAHGLAPGSYRIVFDIAPYFRGQPGGSAFFTRVTLEVELADGDHYHVPLLVSRYGCVSYRGS